MRIQFLSETSPTENLISIKFSFNVVYMLCKTVDVETLLVILPAIYKILMLSHSVASFHVKVWPCVRICFFFLCSDMRLFAVAISHQTVTHSGILLTFFIYAWPHHSVGSFPPYFPFICCYCWQHHQHQPVSAKYVDSTYNLECVSPRDSMNIYLWWFKVYLTNKQKLLAWFYAFERMSCWIPLIFGDKYCAKHCSWKATANMFKYTTHNIVSPIIKLWLGI